VRKEKKRKVEGSVREKEDKLYSPSNKMSADSSSEVRITLTSEEGEKILVPKRVAVQSSFVSTLIADEGTCILHE